MKLPPPPQTEDEKKEFIEAMFIDDMELSVDMECKLFRSGKASPYGICSNCTRKNGYETVVHALYVVFSFPGTDGYGQLDLLYGHSDTFIQSDEYEYLMTIEVTEDTQ